MEREVITLLSIYTKLCGLSKVGSVKIELLPEPPRWNLVPFSFKHFFHRIKPLKTL